MKGLLTAYLNRPGSEIELGACAKIRVGGTVIEAESTSYIGEA